MRLSGHVYRPPHNGGPPPPPYSLLPIVVQPAARAATVTRVQVDSPSVLSGAIPSFTPWVATLRPRIRTAYTAEWFGGRSASVEVEVRPNVTLRRRGGRVFVRIRPANPWRGRYVALQRLGRDGLWHGVARARVSARGTATFAIRVRGTPIRAWVPPAFGYLDGSSARVDA